MDNRKNFTRKVVYHRKMLPRDAVEAPSLEPEDSEAMADAIQYLHQSPHSFQSHFSSHTPFQELMRENSPFTL